VSGALESPSIAPGAHRGWPRGAAPALVVVLTITAFLPTIHNEFLNWDDAQNYLDNPHYRGLGPRQLAWMFTTFHMGHYIPVTWITFGLDYLLWGVSPAGYHLTNILFHAATALAFYFVSLRLLRMALPESQETDLRVGAALAAPALPRTTHAQAWPSKQIRAIVPFTAGSTIDIVGNLFDFVQPHCSFAIAWCAVIATRR